MRNGSIQNDKIIAFAVRPCVYNRIQKRAKEQGYSAEEAIQRLAWMFANNPSIDISDTGEECASISIELSANGY